ncbi:6053_t:CDS:2 [Acaulospora morrowiae]|uniref:6053_t:CDS:1 n=1 Tax=Acaulospora morrowiae TaxID=94023 RepID=A0A9N9CXN9_9GLOM|nr:6053_t:CDS:2 [Acaulospora morrowiae]
MYSIRVNEICKFVFTLVLLFGAKLSNAQSGVINLPFSYAWYLCSSAPIDALSYTAVVVGSSATTSSFGTIQKVNTLNLAPNGGIVAFVMNVTELAVFLNPESTDFYSYGSISCMSPVAACSFPVSKVATEKYCIAVENINPYPITVSISINWAFGTPSTPQTLPLITYTSTYVSTIVVSTTITTTGNCTKSHGERSPVNTINLIYPTILTFLSFIYMFCR